MRNGRAAAVPFGKTVSMWAISSILPLPVPDKRATMLSPYAGIGRKWLDGGAELVQLFDRDGADRIDALFVAGAGIDVDQPLPQLEHVILVMLRPFDDLLVRFGAGTLAGNGESNHRQRGRRNHAARISTLSKRASHHVLR